MKRLLPWLLAAAALLAGLAALLLHGLHDGDAQFASQSEVLRSLYASQVASERNALRTRAGLLRDYDPLVATMRAARARAAALVDGSAGEPRLLPLAEAVRRRLAEQDERLEQFKTANALLQNSFAYFVQVAAGATGSSADPALRREAGALAAAVLLLSQAAGASESRELVEARLAELRQVAAALPPDAASDAAALLRHGELLQSMLVRADELLRDVLADDGEAERAAFLSRLEAERTAEAARAGRYRLALYAGTLLLAAALVGLGAELVARVRALRHRRAVERLMSALSTRLLGCGPADTDAALADAVTALAGAFAAQRGYLLRPDDAALPPAQPWPTGWPEALLAAAPEGPRQVWRVRDLPEGALRRVLEDGGVQAWAGVPLRQGGTLLGLVGFDRFDRVGAWPPGGLGLLVLAVDVVGAAVRRQAALLEQADLERRLARARRLEAVGTFASGIAHNFNNVIGAIVGHAELAGDAIGRGESGLGPGLGYVEQIRRAGLRAQELVGHVLDYRSDGGGPRRPVEVEALVREAAALLGAMPGADVAVDGSGPLVVAGEPDRLYQMFVNLLRNALQVSPPGGRVHVTLDQAESPRRTLSHGQLAAGSYVRVAVRDTGPGMDAATLGRLFQPFFTTRPGGTGLGLATAWESARDLDGGIDVLSAPGAGATFTVWLPQARTQATQAEAAPADATGAAVALVGPDEAARHRDEDIVAALGYEPIGFPAAAACRGQSAGFSVILLDEAAAGDAAGLASGACPVILLQAGPPPATLPAGIVQVLQRPVRPGALAAALARWA